MTKTTWFLTRAFHLVLLCFTRSVLTDSLFKDGQLFEGDRCQLENGGGEGVCTKAVNCSEAMRHIQLGNNSRAGLCGSSKVDEMVCCATSVSEIRNQSRPADAACESYKMMVPKKLPGGIFIQGGVNTVAGKHPSMAALGYAASNEEEGAIMGRKYVCGGTLISLNHVLTAAHCVNNIEGLVPIEVVLGATDLGNPDRLMTQRIPISRVIKHPQHRRSFKYHDVAILELQRSIRFSNWVKPTCLMTEPPTSLTGSVGPRLEILGWGAVDLDGTTSTKLLRAVGLNFVERDKCSESYQNIRAEIPNGLDDGMVCVVDPNSTRRADTCWGDSGGPLLLSRDKYPPLVGVTSFGQACGGSTPAVYASVYKYLSWIEDQVWPGSN